MKRPRDMTQKELEALPMGPSSGRIELYTEEDYSRGAVGRGRIVPVLSPRPATVYYPDDIIGFVDRDGENWTFGQYADGAWFKRHT